MKVYVVVPHKKKRGKICSLAPGPRIVEGLVSSQLGLRDGKAPGCLAFITGSLVTLVSLAMSLGGRKRHQADTNSPSLLSYKRECLSPTRPPSPAPQQLVSPDLHREMMESILDLWSREILCDVTLRAEGRNFPVHKVVLAGFRYQCVTVHHKKSENTQHLPRARSANPPQPVLCHPL